MYLVPFKPRNQLLSMSRMNVRISGEKSSPLLLESPRVTASEPLPDRLDLSFKAHVTIAPLEHLKAQTVTRSELVFPMTSRLMV